MGAIKKPSFLTVRLGLLAAAAIFAVLEFSVLHSLRPLTHFVQDYWVRAEAAASRYDQDIVLVNIDERSLAEMAPLVGRWPWPRSVYAVLLEGILPHDPKAVVFDILVSDRHVEHPESDLYFVKTAVRDERVFMPLVRLPSEDTGKDVGLPLAKYADEMGFIRTPEAQPDAHVAVILPLGKLATTGRTGAINFLADSDGMGRRYPLYQPVQGWRIPSLPMRVALKLDFSLPENATFTLNWGGSNPQQRPAVSFVDMYRAANSKQSPLLNSVAGKIIILGSTAPQLHDSLPTPFSGTHPGLDILATAIANLKNGNWLRTAPDWSNWLACVLLLAVLGYLLQRSKGVLLAGGLLLVLTPTLAVAGLIAARSGWLIGGIAPLAIGWGYYLATGSYAFIQERRSRLHAVRTFGRFLDPRVVAELVKNEQVMPDLQGRSAQITVLFSDIRGFTTLSENRPAEEIVALLNNYFSRQVAIIFKHGGTVDKFIGDAIMAFWGAPLEDEKQAENAVLAALEMAQEVEKFRRDIQSTEFDIGIGIHSGSAVVGFIGSENKLDYTAIGDTVNLASRIEGQTKGRARVLVSEETCNRCMASVEFTALFEFTAHGAVQVKGRSQAVNLFEPTGTGN